jgi:FdhD protein
MSETERQRQYQHQPGTQPAHFVNYVGDERTSVHGGVIEEAQVCLFVNGQELATFMCSPIAIQDLALGFLCAEGFIETLADVRYFRLADNGSCADVWLNKDFEPPTKKIITAGCGGGATFDDLSQTREPLRSAIQLTPQQVAALMKQMHKNAALYNNVRGVHTSALCSTNELLLLAQDIGRHNTIDRLWGMALQRNLDTRDKIIVASGRISSEMLNKAAKMGVPIVISRTSPTSLSVRLAQAWHITVIGYCRGSQFRVYSATDRINAISETKV